MPRENSFSDEGRSVTPDLYEPSPEIPPLTTSVSTPAGIDAGPASPSRPQHVFASPRERFRSTVRKVIHMHRARKSFIATLGGIGAEPGVDPRHASAFINYGHIRANCVIEVVDYSSVRQTFGRMGNTGFVRMLEDEKASAREPWVKVRWINVSGISWDVISAIALKYDLHPLALEDVLHRRTHARSKADYYAKHLFIRVVSHTLGDPDGISRTVDDDAIALTGLPRSTSPGPMSENELKLVDSEDGTEEFGGDEKTVFGSAPVSRFSTKKGLSVRRRKQEVQDEEARMDGNGSFGKSRGARSSALQRTVNRQRAQDLLTIEELKKGDRVDVKLAPVSMFLTRDGTVISFHPGPDAEFFSPIMARLRQIDTVLRMSADPSLLVQALLDLIVDRTLEVVDEYHGKILELEHDILLRPKMKAVRALHILSGDLTLHKRTLEPIRTVIYGLRRYDQDRSAAVIDSSKEAVGTRMEGYMSHKANIYLADVLDHMEFILASLDMFASISENLINYTFNMASYEMNEVMRRLTLATIIFLPLTLLTGYFGMNFSSMWSIRGSDVFFWEVAIPVMLVVIPMFMYRDLERLWHYLKKKTTLRKILKPYKQD